MAKKAHKRPLLSANEALRKLDPSSMNRRSSACERCRRRHCIGSPRCEACNKSGSTCNFEPHKDGRRKAKLHDTEAKLHDTEAKLHDTEAKLHDAEAEIYRYKGVLTRVWQIFRCGSLNDFRALIGTSIHRLRASRALSRHSEEDSTMVVDSGDSATWRCAGPVNARVTTNTHGNSGRPGCTMDQAIP
ncbi:hypothetical protein AAWM_10525 [Aspergillus awamori]|uniref:Zn(2)-C6 fungal-type domain-containing protein n=1 Tax=Aspergillus awamori TaxID=105351 RepID=A0A401L851_ASPAW|nr:hypothetical protein AAWM_10525 [Aspergillus awamori]